ncbi:hypothetical protein [Hymenobacter sp. B81]|uniref:hypothetical protein n=1 Tax=Hymenobacter sp. B81 TaxID=3344878 RepID=UPI0037DC6A8E
MKDPFSETGYCQRCGGDLDTQAEQDAGYCSFCYHEDDDTLSDPDTCTCGELLDEVGACPVCDPIYLR